MEGNLKSIGQPRHGGKKPKQQKRLKQTAPTKIKNKKGNLPDKANDIFCDRCKKEVDQRIKEEHDKLCIAYYLKMVQIAKGNTQS